MRTTEKQFVKTVPYFLTKDEAFENCEFTEVKFGTDPSSTFPNLGKKLFTNCMFSRCKFSGLNLYLTTFINCTFWECEFSNVGIHDALFKTSIFLGTSWTKIVPGGDALKKIFSDCRAFNTVDQMVIELDKMENNGAVAAPIGFVRPGTGRDAKKTAAVDSKPKAKQKELEPNVVAPKTLPAIRLENTTGKYISKPADIERKDWGKLAAYMELVNGKKSEKLENLIRAALYEENETAADNDDDDDDDYYNICGYMGRASIQKLHITRPTKLYDFDFGTIFGYKKNAVLSMPGRFVAEILEAAENEAA